MVRKAMLPESSVPSLQIACWPAPWHSGLDRAASKVVCGFDQVLPTTTPVAVPGPLFCTVIAYVTWSPCGATFLGDEVMVSCKSATPSVEKNAPWSKKLSDSRWPVAEYQNTRSWPARLSPSTRV